MSSRPDRRKHDQRRYAENPWRKWYSNAPWAKAKRRQLAWQPLCEMCEGRGRTVPATIVHHRTPHRGDWAIFIDADKHGQLVHRLPRHRGAKRRTHWAIRMRSDPMAPVDPRHPWNR